MPNPCPPKRSPLIMSALALGLLGAAAPAFAQTTVQELTVTGRLGPNGPTTLSRTVSFADLDLTTDSGRHELDRRIHATANDLCHELGEQPEAVIPPLRQSCEQQAVASAADAEKIAFAQAQPKGYAAAPPPPASLPPAAAPAAPAYGAQASYTTQTITNGPVPDTAENRARYGGPMSNAGKRTKPAGN